MKTTFKAFRVFEEGPKQFRHEIVERPVDELPMGEVLAEVHWSGLNYKDALSASGHKGISRNFPHTPGIDAAGIVVESADPFIQPGSRILVTGFDFGSNTDGGLSEMIRVPGSWVVPLPSGLSLREAMAYGTAGFTAALSLLKMEHNHLRPESGDVLVTGATGGVGTLGIALLAKRGYRVFGGTGKPDQKGFLQSLGAIDILSREQLQETPQKALLSERWAGVLDTVGGKILASVLRGVKSNGSVAACGLAQSHDLSTTVYPFILRGINLLGISSAFTEFSIRRRIWDLLSGDWRPATATLNSIIKECSLEEVSARVQEILEGRVVGRTVVKIRTDAQP